MYLGVSPVAPSKLYDGALIVGGDRNGSGRFTASVNRLDVGPSERPLAVISVEPAAIARI